VHGLALARMSTSRPAWLGALVVLSAASMFGFLGTSSRVAYEAGVQPFAFVAWRAGVGALGIALVVAAVLGPRAAAASLRVPLPAVRRALLVGTVFGAGVNVAMFLAFDRTTVALALLGFYTYPAMVATVSGLLGREPLDLARVVALALALTGMVAVVVGGLEAADAVRIDALGIGLGLAAAGFQTGFVLTSRGFASVRTDVAMGVVLAGSAAVAAAASVATGGLQALTMPFASPSVIVLLVAVGLFAAAVPSVLFLTGIRWIGGVRTGILMLFEPVVGVGLAALLLGEGLTALQAAGGATILLAALIVQRGSRRSAGVPGMIVPAPGGP